MERAHSEFLGGEVGDCADLGSPPAWRKGPDLTDAWGLSLWRRRSAGSCIGTSTSCQCGCGTTGSGRSSGGTVRAGGGQRTQSEFACYNCPRKETTLTAVRAEGLLCRLRSPVACLWLH